MTSVERALSGLRGPVVIGFQYNWRTSPYIPGGPLEAVRVGGSLTMDVMRTVSITGRFQIESALLPAGFDPSTSTAYIAVSANVLVDGVSQNFPLAVLRLDISETETVENGVQRLEVNGSDLSIVLLSRTTTPQSYPAGTNYMTVIAGVLTGLGLDGSGLPAVAATLPIDLGFGPATPWRTIVDTLTDSVNHFPIWAQANGVFTTRARVDPNIAPLSVSYSTQSEPQLIVPSFRQRANRSQVKNRAVVLIDHPLRAAAYALRENNDPTVGISIPALGEAITEQIAGPYVLDTATAGAWADWFLRDQVARSNLATLRTAPDPRRGIRETYSVTVEGADSLGVYTALGWTLPLSPGGVMEHTIGRTQPVTLTTP